MSGLSSNNGLFRSLHFLLYDVQWRCFSLLHFVRRGGLCVQKRKALLQAREVPVRVGLRDRDQRDAPGLLGMLAPQAQEVGAMSQFGHATLIRMCCGGLR